MSDPGPFILGYVLAGLLFSLGLVLLIFGRLGKRVDDHPWCRKCRFDLFGRDDNAKSSCPECGCDLSKPKAIRIGQRRKRQGMVLSGVLLLAIGLAGMGVQGYGDAAGVEWQHHKPVWWLMRDANGTPGLVSDDALFELRRRYTAGLLSDKQIASLVGTGLKHQADLSRTWQPEWGDFIEDARRGRNPIATQAQWDQYIDHIMQDPLQFKLRTRLVAGTERIALHQIIPPVRCGTDWDSELWFNLFDARLEFGATSVDVSPGSTVSGIVNFAYGQELTNIITLPDGFWENVQAGKHNVRFACKLSAYEYNFMQRATTPYVTKPYTLETKVDVLPAGSSSVTLIQSDNLKLAVKQSVQLESARLRMNSTHGFSPNELNIRCNIVNPPVGGVYTIVVRDGDTEHHTGLLVCPKGDEFYYTTTVYNPGVSIGDQVDIILRPSVEDAEETHDCYEIWGEDIVFKDVTIESAK